MSLQPFTFSFVESFTLGRRAGFGGVSAIPCKVKTPSSMRLARIRANVPCTNFGFLRDLTVEGGKRVLWRGAFDLSMIHKLDLGADLEEGDTLSFDLTYDAFVPMGFPCDWPFHVNLAFSGISK